MEPSSSSLGPEPTGKRERDRLRKQRYRKGLSPTQAKSTLEHATKSQHARRRATASRRAEDAQDVRDAEVGAASTSASSAGDVHVQRAVHRAAVHRARVHSSSVPGLPFCEPVGVTDQGARGSPEESGELADCAAPSISVRVARDAGGTPYQELPIGVLGSEALTIVMAAHGVPRGRARNLEEARMQASRHRCSDACRKTFFVMSHVWPKFKCDDRADCDKRLRALLGHSLKREFPVKLSDDARRQLISRWLDHMSDKTFEEVVCAVCSERVFRSLADVHDMTDEQLQVLTNSNIPAGCCLTGYDTSAFCDAILDSKGILDHTSRRILVCKSCWKHVGSLTLPPLALANDNYLGHEALPANIRYLFDVATTVELALIARYRTKCTIYKFSKKENTPQYGTPDAFSQRFSRGNVITFANGNTELLDVLPPSPRELSETISVIFVGSALPTPEEITRLTPLLVRRRVIVPLLQWLKTNNPLYSEVRISMENLDELLHGQDEGVPGGIGIHLVRSTTTESASSGYVPTESVPAAVADQASLERNGVLGTSIDGMPLSEVKLLALRHWKTGGAAYSIPHRSRPIVEWNNPSLFPGMYPHLFPWGEGGLESDGRRIPVGLDAHVKHLLNLSNRRFQTDHSFIFVAMNVIQKRKVWKASRFKVRRSAWKRAAEFMSSAEVSVCEAIIKRSSASKGYVAPENDAEKAVFGLMREVKVTGEGLPGTPATKARMRNEIRAMCHFIGLPTFFFTLNPADLHHPLFCKLAGADVSLDERQARGLPSQFERARMLARNPVAGAKFFHAMMTAFIEVLVGDIDHPGVFGPVRAFYGTIECQGRGSLHCHMLIWVDGGLGPEAMRAKLRDDPAFKAELFTYLEDTIHTCLPGDRGPVRAEDAVHLLRDPDEPHSSTIKCPHPEDEDFAEEWDRQLQRLVYDCNFHTHKDTCFQNLKPGEPRDSKHCRMRMNGATRPTTELDGETGSILHQRWHPWINQHNRTVSNLTKCNSDCKFIGSGPGAKALIYYATDYITKNNLPTYVAFAALQRVLEMMKEGPQPESESEHFERGKKMLMKACNAIMSEMDMSGQDVSMHLLHTPALHADHYTSHQFEVLHWHNFWAWMAKKERDVPNSPDACASQSRLSADAMDAFPAVEPCPLFEMQDPLGPIVSDDEEDEVSFNTNDAAQPLAPYSQVDDYVFRGPGLEGIALYWFVASVEKISISSENVRLGKRKRDTEASPRSLFTESHPMHLTSMLRMRHKLKIPVVLGPSLPRRDQEDQYENYCKAMLMLFKPWRQMSDLKSDETAWSDMFEATRFAERSQEIMENMHAMYECKDARDEYSDLRRRGVVTHDLINEHVLNGTRPNLAARGQHDGEDDDWASLLADHPGVAAVLNPCAPEAGPLISRASFHDPVRFEKARQLARQAMGCDDTSELAGAGLVGVDAAQLVSAADRRAHVAYRADTAAFVASDAIFAPEARSPKSRSPEPNTRMMFEGTLDPMVEEVLYEHEHLRVEPSEALSNVVRELKLNKEQSAAVGIVAAHKMENSIRQLMMLVTGCGGTGKSFVVRALDSFFEKIGESKMLKKGGPTGCSSFLIHAQTLHHSLRLRRNTLSPNSLLELQTAWAGVSYLLIDEVSMIGAKMLSQISMRLCDITGSTHPFGGLNVVFFGDVRQLPPVMDGALWGGERPAYATAHTGRPQNLQYVAHGRVLWSAVNIVVVLGQNFRQKDDAQYQELLNRLGDGRAVRSDCDVLNTRICRNGKMKADFSDAPLLTCDKVVRDAWNDEAVNLFARRSGRAAQNYVAKDVLSGEAVKPSVQRALWDVTSSVTKDRLGRLPLVRGMKVMILSNIVTKFGVVNGAEGTLENVFYELDDQGERMATCAYVRVQECELKYDGLDKGVVPIFPEVTQYRLRGQSQKTHIFSRTQLPIIPAYAYTDFKIQGRTILSAILDLASTGRHIEAMYVMCSRVVKLTNVLILRPFPHKLLLRKLPKHTRTELDRLINISTDTMLRWNRSNLSACLGFLSDPGTSSSRLEHPVQ